MSGVGGGSGGDGDGAGGDGDGQAEVILLLQREIRALKDDKHILHEKGQAMAEKYIVQLAEKEKEKSKREICEEHIRKQIAESK